MFARASCEDRRPLCLFCILYALSRPPLPLYHESPFLLPVTGHRFHPLPIRMRQSCLPRRRWYNFAHFVIRDNIPRIRFLHHWTMTIVKRGQTVSKEMLESRRETSQPFKGGRQPIRIPIRRRGNCRDYSMFLTNSCTRFKQSPSIERRSDPTEDPSIPSLKPESSDTLQDRGDPRRQQERRRGQRRFAIRTFARRMLHGGRGTIDRSTFLSTNRRANETLVDR